MIKAFVSRKCKDLKEINRLSNHAMETLCLALKKNKEIYGSRIEWALFDNKKVPKIPYTTCNNYHNMIDHAGVKTLVVKELLCGIVSDIVFSRKRKEVFLRICGEKETLVVTIPQRLIVPKRRWAEKSEGWIYLPDFLKEIMPSTWFEGYKEQIYEQIYKFMYGHIHSEKELKKGVKILKKQEIRKI